jgi:hypothetical protein
MTTIAQISAEVQRFLGVEADELGRRSGFIQRQGKWSGSQFAQSLIFGWLGNGGASLSELSQSAANVGVNVSRQGVAGRFTEAGATFMRQLVEAASGYVWQGQAVNHPLLNRLKGVYLLDSTVVALPADLASVWAGCGGSQGQSASLKIHTKWEMCYGTLQVELDAGQAHDQSTTFVSDELEAETMRLTHLGYYALDTFGQLSASGAYWLSRYKLGTWVGDVNGEELAVLAFLQAHQSARIDGAIVLGKAHRLPCRLIAEKVPPTVLAQRHATLWEWARRHQQPLSPERLALAAWSIWVTNLPPTRLSAAEVLVLATYRWQIELLFKLWKSELQLDSWRTTNPWRILCECYAKLIAALFLHAIALLAGGHAPERSLTQMAHTIRHFAWTLAAFLNHPERFSALLTQLVAVLASGCRIAKSRIHPRTFQRLQASVFLA